MQDSTRSTLKLFGNVGAGLVAFSTLVAWYSFHVAFSVPATAFWVPESLWSLYPGAAALICAGALVGLALVNVPSLAQTRWAGVAIALVGLAVVVYSAVRILDLPSFGVFDVARPFGYGTIERGTDLDGGPFLALTGGFLLTLGALPVLVTAGERSRSFSGSRSPAMGGGPGV